jgi:hypothetical protein
MQQMAMYDIPDTNFVVGVRACQQSTIGAKLSKLGAGAEALVLTEQLAVGRAPHAKHTGSLAGYQQLPLGIETNRQDCPEYMCKGRVGQVRFTKIYIGQARAL